MKTKKLLSRLAEFLDRDRRAQLAEADSIKEVLRKLKNKEQHLKEQLKEENDAKELQALEVKLAVVHAQRKKGEQLLREIMDKPVD